MVNGERAARAQAQELLEQRNFRDALDLLKQHPPLETDGEGHALLALAHYHLEQYPSAVEHYTAALRHDANNREWREMLAIANGNVIANVDVPVPDIYFFDRATLLANPEVPEGTFPRLPDPVMGPGLLKRLRNGFGWLVGIIATFVTDALTKLVGKTLD